MAVTSGMTSGKGGRVSNGTQRGKGAGKATPPQSKAAMSGGGSGVSPKGGAPAAAKARFSAKGHTVGKAAISKPNTPPSGPMKSRTQAVRSTQGRRGK